MANCDPEYNEARFVFNPQTYDLTDTAARVRETGCIGWGNFGKPVWFDCVEVRL
jgi:hypothetical protein